MHHRTIEWIEAADKELADLRAEVARLTAELSEAMRVTFDPGLCGDITAALDHVPAATKTPENDGSALLHAVERCYAMLLSEPDANGAAFKAENILRAAIEDAKAAQSLAVQKAAQ